MHKTMIWAGVAGALALATAAIAQTTNSAQDPNMPATSSSTTRDTTTSTGAYTPNANTSAANTSATSATDQGTNTAVNQAGERG
jgi:hypothetical protein